MHILGQAKIYRPPYLLKKSQIFLYYTYYILLTILPVFTRFYTWNAPGILGNCSWNAPGKKVELPIVSAIA